MKRLHILTFCAVLTLLLCCLLPTKAEAATEGSYTYEVSNGEATITDCNTSISGDITIPSTLGGYPVTSIGEFAFEHCKALTGVTIGKGIIEISPFAFNECTSLSQVNIPDSITSIGSFAFCGCSSLVGMTIPDSVTGFGMYTFSYCDNLSEVIFSENSKMTSICYSAFYSCDGLTSITIPDSVTSIGEAAFAVCSSLTSVTIPNSVTSIDAYAFIECSNLTSVAIGNSVISIGDEAFDYCSSLNHVAYAGTKERWGEIAIGDLNESLTGASQFHYETAFKTVDDCVEIGIYCPVCMDFVIRNKKENGTHLFENGVCTACGESEFFRMVLTEDAQVSISLERDVYIDLAGYDLTGTIVTNGYKVYGMDSTTDDYTCERIGYFTCVDENGSFIVPERTYTYGEKQYLTICTEDRYSFHRYYVGVTHMSLAPETAGLGYKSVIFGDEMVFAELSATKAFSFKLQLEGYNPVYRHFDRNELTSGDPITLRIRNYDVENYSEHNLYAQVSLTLSDGTVIETERIALTFRWLTEQVNTNYTDYTSEQLASFKAMLQAFDIVKKWDIPNLI